MRLQGKTAPVTGVASGFGTGIARTFAREGAKVVLMDLNGDGARSVAASIGDAATAVQGWGACRKPGFSCLTLRPMLRCRSVRPRIRS